MNNDNKSDSTKPHGFFEERPFPATRMTPARLQYLTRRDVLLLGAAAVGALAGGGVLLPQETLRRLGVRRHMDSAGKEWFLNKALRYDGV
ncbi:MAG TPA: twin-arginine translocation signal domain-containing protein [Vicinamibacterales bacterium]